MKIKNIPEAAILANRIEAVNVAMDNLAAAERITLKVGPVEIGIDGTEPNRAVVADAVTAFLTKSRSDAEAQLSSMGVEDAQPEEVMDRTIKELSKPGKLHSGNCYNFEIVGAVPIPLEIQEKMIGSPTRQYRDGLGRLCVENDCPELDAWVDEVNAKTRANLHGTKSYSELRAEAAAIKAPGKVSDITGFAEDDNDA